MNEELTFKEKFKRQIQKTVINAFKLSTITWAIGTWLIVNNHIPCNSATEYGIYTGYLFLVLD